MEELHGLPVPRTLEDACDPRRLALVVCDMQVGILEQLEGADAVLAGVRRALDAARAAGVRTLFLRHVTLPTRLMGASQLRMWAGWQRAASVADVVSPFPPGARRRSSSRASTRARTSPCSTSSRCPRSPAPRSSPTRPPSPASLAGAPARPA